MPDNAPDPDVTVVRVVVTDEGQLFRSERIRLECIAQAINLGIRQGLSANIANTDQILGVAREFESFIKTGGWPGRPPRGFDNDV